MGSLRTMQYHDIQLLKPPVEPIHKKKPMQMILGVLKADSDPNRSPLGSPPIEKKRLRRLSNVLLNSAGSQKHQQVFSQTQVEAEKENMSVVELTRLQAQNQQICHRPLSSSSSILKHISHIKTHPSRCSHSRKVQFRTEVLVQYIDEQESATNETLADNHDRMAFLARNILRRSHSHDFTDSMLQSSHSTSQLPTFQDNPLYRAPPAGTQSQNSPTATTTTSEQGGKSVNISFSQNSRGYTFMKFVVFMGPHYDPDNIVVKANMSGNRLRVVANKVSRPLGGEDVVKEEYNERFQLPMQVDPYKVEARLDSRGFLTVDAPLMTSDQRRVAEQKVGISV